MERIEKLSAVFLVAGLFLFIVAVLTLAAIPVWMLDKETEYTGAPNIVPDEFQAYYADSDSYQKALFRGRDIYIKEGCWHCHSQYVRPTANENLRYGPVSTPGEYQNLLHLPQLFGTRRVGPDLSREAGKKSNDWHFAHLYKPVNVVPESVMPEYPWLFKIAGGEPMLDEDGDPIEDDEGNEMMVPIRPVPTEDGVALVAYLQWLGSSTQSRQETKYDYRQITRPPRN